MRKTLILVAIAVVAAIVVWQVLGRAGPEGDGKYEFVEVARGDIEDVISSTGTLSAVGTVEVGTQVSGKLSQVFADFNDNVRKGQVLALIDTTFLAGSVKDAKASLMKAESQLALVETQHARSRDLFERGLVSEADYEDADAQLASARASVLSAEAALDRAKTNLDYAVIRSPISGTVIARSVEPGQTVAASLSAPVLFIIAEDLAEMEIHALVDESDIGQVEVGQDVRFTVDAYYDREFWGVVRQIRLQPQTISNIVNYTVVVDAPNDEGLLLPGMTATADFLLEHREDVLLVPNAALRFTPTMEMFAELRESMADRRPPGGGDGPGRAAGGVPESGDGPGRGASEDAAGGGDGSGRGAPDGATASGDGSGREAAVGAPAGGKRSGRAAGAASGRGGSGQSGGPAAAMMAAMGIDEENGALLWHLDEDGKLAVTPIEKGATDGAKTEIVKGRGISEGMKVITAVIEAPEDDGQSNNPLAAPFGRRRRR
jgi:HlyD family secretion protein